MLFWYGLQLCKILQKEKIGLKQAIEDVEHVLECLKNLRTDADTEFHTIMEEVKVPTKFILSCIITYVLDAFLFKSFYIQTFSHLYYNYGYGYRT